MKFSNNPYRVISQNRAGTRVETLSFPKDDTVTQNKMLITLFEYRRGNPMIPPTEDMVAQIVLPIPPSGFIDSTDLNYDDEVGMGGFVGGTLGLASKPRSPSELGAAGLSAFQLAMKELGKGMVQRVGDLAGQGRGTGAANALEIGAGLAVNQNIGMVFKGVQLRKHDFTWTLVPKNLDESRELDKILLVLKQKSLPVPGGEANFALKYPHVAQIEFFPKNYLKISKMGCFITNMKINYAPDGQPAFFKSEGHPAAVELTLSFAERAIMTSSDYDDGLYSISGDQ